MSTVRRILQMKGNDKWNISPEATVYAALKMMATRDVGCLLVMEDEKLVGVLKERDCARKVILQRKSSRTAPVREIMTVNFHPIHPDQTVEEGMSMMAEFHTRHLPVVDHDRVLGVISLGDVVNFKLHKQREIIKGLEQKITEIKSGVPS
jgi:CBS domain-containing protein